jgi:glucose/arabinose dehydrogenase
MRVQLVAQPALRTYLAAVAFTLSASTAHAAGLPAGFSESLVASGLTRPTAMQFAPDGRLFVCEQGGRLRVIRDGVLLPTPFLTVSVSASGERGLLGVAFDPNFAVNHFVYVYYTVPSATPHNRISRFTANGDVAVPGSQRVILELNNLTSATIHNGGALAFGEDGKLYAAIGDNATHTNAQSLSTLLGKMLRINADGSVPTDNPFFVTATGKNRAIWARGLRNPFTFAFNRGGTRMFINDVGKDTYEEINDGVAGANYGWPTTEGPTADPRFESPRYTYTHTGGACAITGGAFYTPLVNKFPSGYVNDYFFADYCAGWIHRLDPAGGNAVTGFASGIPSPVDLKVSDDGALYYLARGTSPTAGVVYRIEYGQAAPRIVTQPASRTVTPGASVTFSVQASGTAPLRYQWQRNRANIAGATAREYRIAAAAQSDNGARFRVIVSNDFGSVTSSEALLTVSTNRPPTATITRPVAGTLYSGGSVISYGGTATDPEDGALPPGAFTWRVDFHHDTHTHPFIAPTSGATSGTFTIPRIGETSANVWYRIYLTVKDSAGRTTTVQRDILPRKVRVTLATSPVGRQLRLDGQPVSTPLAFDAVVGIIRAIAAPTPQTAGGVTYQFLSWSDGGAASHNITTPSANTTYTATFRSTGGATNGLLATYFDGVSFTGASLTRVDPTVNFAWGSGSPAGSIGADTFSVRWTGSVEPQFTQVYRFFTQSDDGVRVWVNGRQLVNNWTDHSLTENSGSIALTAGQRYDIRVDYYERTGGATIRLLWSGASTPKAIIPSARLFPSGPGAPIRINFQPASAPVPAGYLRDSGAVFGSRGNGQTYGWNADTSAQMRDRNAPNSPDQRYDTLAYTQRSGNPNAIWEIGVPNGTYVVRVVSGDPSYFGGRYSTVGEGVQIVNGAPSTSARWIDGTRVVSVPDGRLTIRNGPGASNNKICFVEITPR